MTALLGDDVSVCLISSHVMVIPPVCSVPTIRLLPKSLCGLGRGRGGGGGVRGQGKVGWWW